jgi:hypothetical protein
MERARITSPIGESRPLVNSAGGRLLRIEQRAGIAARIIIAEIHLTCYSATSYGVAAGQEAGV